MKSRMEGSLNVRFGMSIHFAFVISLPHSYSVLSMTAFAFSIHWFEEDELDGPLATDFVTILTGNTLMRLLQSEQRVPVVIEKQVGPSSRRMAFVAGLGIATEPELPQMDVLMARFARHLHRLK